MQVDEGDSSLLGKRACQPGVQPGAARHIASRDVGHEQYYTNERLAKRLLTLALDQDNEGDALFFEPSVGRGVIYSGLPEKRRLGVELCKDADWCQNKPEANLYLGQDFFDFELPCEYKDRSLVVVGNPPFAGDMQVRFLNHAAELECRSLTVVFILGLSMRKWSNIGKVNKSLHLTDERIVPRKMSYFLNHGKKVTVPTVIQVWTRKNELRTSDPELVKEDPTFKVLPCVDWRQANIVLKRFASLACLGEIGVVGKDVDICKEAGKQVNAYFRKQPRKRFGTVVGKSGAQGTLMLIKAHDVDRVASEIRALWNKGKGTFKEYVNETTSNVGNGVCINKEELFTLYNKPDSIMRARRYL